MLLLCFFVCVTLVAHFNATDSIGFHVLGGREAAESRLVSTPWLMVFRLIAVFMTAAVPGGIVFGAREKSRSAQISGTELPKWGGYKAFCTFTIWSWTAMAFYSLQAAVVTIWFEV